MHVFWLWRNPGNKYEKTSLKVQKPNYFHCSSNLHFFTVRMSDILRFYLYKNHKSRQILHKKPLKSESKHIWSEHCTPGAADAPCLTATVACYGCHFTSSRPKACWSTLNGHYSFYGHRFCPCEFNRYTLRSHFCSVAAVQADLRDTRLNQKALFPLCHHRRTRYKVQAVRCSLPMPPVQSIMKQRGASTRGEK